MQLRSTFGVVLVLGVVAVSWVVNAQAPFSLPRGEEVTHDIRPGPGVTARVSLSDYEPTLAGTPGQTPIFVLDSGKPGATVLVVGPSSKPTPDCFHIRATATVFPAAPDVAWLGRSHSNLGFCA